MAFWKQNDNRTEGFSLIEVVVSIAILGIVVVPMLSGLLFSFQLNHRSDERLQAQLAVSNAVETIMAEGFDPSAEYVPRFPDVAIVAEAKPDESNPVYYELKVSCGDIVVDTCVRPHTGGEPG